MSMNETETCDLIMEQLFASGWKRDDHETGMRIRREYHVYGQKKHPRRADFVLEYKNTPLAVIEAKNIQKGATEGASQANDYSKKLNLNTSFLANGKEIYQITYEPHWQGEVDSFPAPQELWDMTYPDSDTKFESFCNVPFEISRHEPRYYQEVAVNKAMQAIANGEKRILLTLATGTGKTYIASQIAWKLFESGWSVEESKPRPHILFLTDRNILADQAQTDFEIFGKDAIARITPDEITKRKGEMPTNASVFISIFQTLMPDKEEVGERNYEKYDKDFFDFIIIDECHRGGANDESTWREILEYFESATQLGLTATPRHDKNVNTYEYFKNHAYTYSLKEGIGDGFLSPYQVIYFHSNIDAYNPQPDDFILEGTIEEGKTYTESEINRKIEIKAREQKRINDMFSVINPDEKTIIFCVSQKHALLIRDMINETARKGADYCARVTADDAKDGERDLNYFTDNAKTIPTILTTSRKLSTGVDAQNVRNIVLLRPVNSMIEFKQIIGRGTRIYEGKEYFTIVDFVRAYEKFNDDEWDGKPFDIIDGNAENVEKEEYDFDQKPKKKEKVSEADNSEYATEPMIKVKLSNKRVMEIRSVHGKLVPVGGKVLTPEKFLIWLFEDLRLPELLGSEKELCETWGNPEKRKELLQKIEEAGCPREHLKTLQEMIQSEDCDMVDVLVHVAYEKKLTSRIERVKAKKEKICKGLNDKECEFVDYVLDNYAENGEGEFDRPLSSILNMKYKSNFNAEQELGKIEHISGLFLKIQQQLYA